MHRLSWTPIYVPFPFANLHLAPFAVINRNLEYSGFAEFSESQRIVRPEGGLGGPQHTLLHHCNKL